MRTPTWIVFEGIDGSGKTTQAKLLNEYLNCHGVRSVYRHVFDTEAGKLLREMFINNAFSNTVEILILSAARQALIEEITAGIDCDVVIVDRFFLSILAMQGRNDGDVELITYLRDLMCKDRIDSVVFHLKTSPEECDKRLGPRDHRDRIEEKGVEFHRTVFDRYLSVLRNETNVYYFDGDDAIDEVHQAIVDRARRLLDLAPAPEFEAVEP